MTPGALGQVTALSDSHDLASFDSGVPTLDHWLRHSARVGQAAGTAATYVLARGDRVIGYYSLAMSAVAHTQGPSRLRRGMPDPVPVILLARLAVDLEERCRHIDGYLLVDALRRCVQGGREFGARAVVVDAVDTRAAAFYRHFGFHDLVGRRLWRRLSDIAAALGT